MRRILAFSGMTVRMLARRRTIWGVCALTALALLGIGLIPSYGVASSGWFVLDLGMSAMELGGLVLAIGLGAGIFPRDRETRILLPLLAVPLSRGGYIAGRFLGGAFVQIAMTLLWAVALMIVMLARGLPVPGGFLVSCALLGIEGCFLLSVVVALGFRVSPPLNAPLTFLGFIICSLGRQDFISLLPGAPGAMGLLWTALPHMAVFHVKDAIMHGFRVPPGFVLLAVLYGVSYTLLTLSLAYASFSRRDLR